MDEIERRYLALLPDVPRWVGTRHLLSCETSVVVENATRSGVVVWSERAGVGSVVGEPDATALARAADAVSELLVFPENLDPVRSLSPDSQAESATVFAAPADLPRAPSHACRQLSQAEIEPLNHLTASMLEELSEVAGGGVTVVAAFDGARPVAFAYAAAETETLWEVSIDTIESHRRRGYARAAVLHRMRQMREKGKTAVWGALESNRASERLARRLGFTEDDKLWILTRRAP